MPKPIKRHPALQPLSRDHHIGLLLCFKIREGLKYDIEPWRIKAYTDWSWEQELAPHFKLEEQYAFPVLGKDHPLVQQALKEHHELHRLFETGTDLPETLLQIEEKLKQHIRFEERVLFNEIQQQATREQLAKIEASHRGSKDCELWPDKFWIREV
jgi:iron-sulfur cluster repair protein YtfE (RIC family)